MKILGLREWRGSTARLLSAALLAAVASSCHPGDITSVADADVVITAYDPAFSFASVRTYAMPDSVVAIDIDGSNNIYDHALDAQILANVASNMAAAGFVREPDPETNGADLILLVGVNVSNNYMAYTYYPYDPWYGWYGGWNYWGGYPGYGGYYPWYPGYGGYPGYTSVSNIKTGSIVLELVDPNVTGSATEGQSLAVRWAAVLNGLAEGDAGSARVSRAIDQAFDQSPYLGN